jgi:alpha-glucosidase
VTRFEARDDGLTLQCGEDVLLVRALAENIVEVHLRPRGQAGRDTLVLAPGRSGPYPWTWKDNPEAITGQTKRVQIRLTKQPLTLTVLDSNGKLILADKGSLGAQAVTFSHAAGHRFYGVLARGGREIQLRNGSHKVSAGRQGTGGGPFLWTTAGYGLLWDSDGGTVDLADRSVAITASRSDMRVFVLTGGPREIISAQARLAGYPPLFPKFAHGFMNTEWGIDQKELLNDVATYRRKGIPIDMFILDYDWFGYGQDNWGDFTWNDKNFPDGASGKLCKEILAAQGMKIATIRKPRLGGNTVQRRRGFCVCTRTGRARRRPATSSTTPRKPRVIGGGNTRRSFSTAALPGTGTTRRMAAETTISWRCR